MTVTHHRRWNNRGHRNRVTVTVTVSMWGAGGGLRRNGHIPARPGGQTWLSSVVLIETSWVESNWINFIENQNRRNYNEIIMVSALFDEHFFLYSIARQLLGLDPMEPPMLCWFHSSFKSQLPIRHWKPCCSIVSNTHFQIIMYSSTPWVDHKMQLDV